MSNKVEMVIGMLMDFGAYLTTREVPVTLGAAYESPTIIPLIQDFLANRGITLNNHTGCAIDTWQDELKEDTLLQGVVDSVTAWHKATGLPAPEKITFNGMDYDHPTRKLRRKLLHEEYVEEYSAAELTHDLPELADALADMIYIIVGTAVSYGIPLEAVMREVCRTNDAKLVFNEQGQVRRRDDGKILKPAGWQPPDIQGILDNHGYEE